MISVLFLGRTVSRVAVTGAVAGCVSTATPAVETEIAPLGPPGTSATYWHESKATLRGNVVGQFTLDFGPVEEARGHRFQWLALHARKANGHRFAVWMFSRAFPFSSLEQAGSTIERYLVQEGEEPPREFRHRFTGAPVLPSLGAREHLWPRPPEGGLYTGGFALRVEWLGHRYVLSTSNRNEIFPVPESPRRIELLPDVLVGVPSNTRTKDDVRRFDGSDYEMVRLTRDDYTAMIRAGMNCFRVDAQQAGWLKDEPVFLWGLGPGDVAFPESLFRSTYLGPSLFLDEPAVGTRDGVIRPRLAKDPEFRSTLTPEVVLSAFKEHFYETVHQGAPTVFMKSLISNPDVDAGTMSFPQRNLYSWETMIASAAWQLTAAPDGGPRAIVFEPPGRLGAQRTVPEWNMAYGCQLPPGDPANLWDVIIGFLRGAARAADKDWGVSIYGAVDRADAPWALTHAYDLGAKYFFFWDNYQLACVPHGEALALARHLRGHVESRPDRDHSRLRCAAEVLILLPPGYDLGHTHMGRGNLWGLGELNLERTNRHGVRLRQVMANCFTEIERCRRQGIAFDLAWDIAGLRADGYREVVRAREDGRVELAVDGRRSVRRGPRTPERPGGVPPRLTVELSRGDRGTPLTIIARAQVTEGSSPVHYTTGTDRRGVYQNAVVLWELFGPDVMDYRTLSSVRESEPATNGAPIVVTAKCFIERPGRYRLRAATSDLAGRPAVVWKEFKVEP